MKEVEEKVLESGIVIDNDILKVDSFINHQIDIGLLRKISKYLANSFENVDKILTIETSGIAFATGVAMELGDVPLLFAKKSKSKIVDPNAVYTAVVKSFTRNIQSEVTVSKNYLKKGERVLIVDDFLAEGNASLGLIDICKQAGAEVAGVAIVVEKGFQPGRARLEELGVKVVSCAVIKEFKDNKPVF